MATLISVKGLDVPNATSGAGANALKDNFVKLVNWSPKSKWDGLTDPATTDNVAANYYAGSFWLNTTTNRLFVCTFSTSTTAVWLLVPTAPSATTLGSLPAFDTNGALTDPGVATASSGRLGLGASSPHTRLQVAGPIATAAATVTTSTTLGDNHSLVQADCQSTNSVALTLPSSTTCTGRHYTILRIDDPTGGTLSVSSGGGQIHNASNPTGTGSISITARYVAYTFVSVGANWVQY